MFCVSLMVNPSKVRVSDEEVSLEFGTDSYLCYVSGYSWRETIFT